MMRRSNPLSAAFAGFVLTCFALSPTPAAATPTAPMPVQLVRAGDNQMSCEALAAEINQLAQAGQPVAAAAAQPKKKRSGLLRALGQAAPLLGPVGMLGGGVAGALASSAVSAASTAGATSQTDDMMDQSRAMMTRAMAGPSIESQRKDRLTAIFEGKRC